MTPINGMQTSEVFGYEIARMGIKQGRLNFICQFQTHFIAYRKRVRDSSGKPGEGSCALARCRTCSE